MPYMPTNMSPNNVTLVAGDDIVFHCLIDKYDTITRAKLTLYNYYNREENAFIELKYDDITNDTTIIEEGLSFNISDSSILPFVASNYDIPVFSIGVFGNNTTIHQSKYEIILEEYEEKGQTFVNFSRMEKNLIDGKAFDIKADNEDINKLLINPIGYLTIDSDKKIVSSTELLKISTFTEKQVEKTNSNGEKYSVNVYVYELNIFDFASTFLSNYSKNSICYTLEIENKDNYDNWIFEGELQKNPSSIDDDSNQIKIFIFANPLLNDAQQKILNANKEPFNFTQLDYYFEENNVLDKWDETDAQSFIVKNDIKFAQPIVYTGNIASVLEYVEDTENSSTMTDYIFKNYLKKFTITRASDNESFTYTINRTEKVCVCTDSSVPNLSIKVENFSSGSSHAGETLILSVINDVDGFFYFKENPIIRWDWNRKNSSSNLYTVSISGTDIALFEENTEILDDDIVAEIDGVPYTVTKIDVDKRKISVMESLESLKNFTNQFIYLYKKYNTLMVDKKFLLNTSSKIVPLKSLSIEENPFPSNTVPSFTWNEPYYHENVYYLQYNFTEEDELKRKSILNKINTFQYYIKDLSGNFKFLGKAVSNSDLGVYFLYGNAYDIYFSNCFGYSSIGDKGYKSEEIYIKIPYYIEKNSSNNYFEIKSNTLLSSENVFSFQDRINFSILETINNNSIKIFQGKGSEKNNIDYSQWTLKQDGRIVDQSQKSYFKIEDYQYDNFEPNSKYELYLKVHDKRNIDWESFIEIETDKEFIKIDSLESAEIKDKAVLIDITKSSSDFNYKNGDGDSWNIKQNINHSFGDFVIKFQVSNKDKDVITISAKDNNTLYLAYIEGVGYYLEYNTTPIASPFSLNTETWYWLYYNSEEQNIKILDENNSNPIAEGSNIVFNNFESLFIGKGIKTFNIEFLTNTLKDFESSLSSWESQWRNGAYFSYRDGDDKAKISPASNFLIKRHELELIKGNLSEQIWMQRGEDVLENIEFSRKNSVTLCSVDKKVSTIKDYGAGQGKFYQYEIIPLTKDLNKSYITNIINTDNWYEINLFGTKSYYKETINSQYEIDENNLWTFELDAKGDDITFNAVNTPNANSGSIYPKITTGNKNYLSGTVTMYLGSNNDGIYARDNDSELFRFLDFANNDSVKFLKLKNGMVIPVAITLKSSSNKSNLIGNPTTITVEWTQVDDAKKSSLIGIEEG